MNKQFTAILTLLALAIFPNLGAAQIKIDRPVKIDPSVISVASSVTKKAKYRVTLNGFICNRPTNDDITQSDGVDDEVFVAAESRYFSANQPRPTVARVQSMVIGDTNNHPNRLRGGSGHNLFGGNGGFLAGDRYPTTTPWTRAGAPATDRLPLVVWQGELEEGVSGVYIFPTVWEWDDTPGLLDQIADSGLFKTFANPIQDFSQMFGIINSRPPGIRPAYEYVTVGGLGSDVVLNRNLFGDKKDRPIGMWNGEGGYRFMPQLLALSYQTAEAALASDPVGRGRGIFEVNYRDDNNLRGDYTLYLQVERIP